MNILDSSGWLSFFSGDENAGTFATVIKDTDHLLVPTICLYEVFKRVYSQRGDEEALKVSGVMSLGKVEELTAEITINAAIISVENKLAMADSVILATARANQATLWTQDKDFSGFEGVEYIERR